MMTLFPSQYDQFSQRVRLYVRLLGLLQIVGLVVILAVPLSFGRPSPLAVILGYPMGFLDLWLLQAVGLVAVGWLVRRFAIQVVCPQCLGSLARFRRHRVYYCPACDEYTDDGTMERLSQQSMAAPSALHQQGREWNRRNCLARIGGPETIPSADKAFPVPPGPGPCSR